jgi:signal transduction histidine kinase
LLRNQKQFRQVHLHEELQPDLPLINGDTNQLQQVLLNLALNGCEAMPEGGTLTVQTRVSDDRYVRLDVSDTGEGIPPERLDQIFEPFFTTKSASKGTGLGLSVTYGIIEQHQGHIDVHSTIGRGSTFSVYLPIHTGDSESSQSVS